MKLSRRNFLLGSVAVAVLPKLALSSERSVSFSYQVNIKERGKARLWLPIPINTEYQRLTGISISGNFESARLTQDPLYRAPTLYVEFGDRKEKRINVLLSTTYKERSVPLTDANYGVPESLGLYLKATPHVPTTGRVKELAEEITKGKKTLLEKAYAIYEWVVENTYRDPKVKGCGPGNVNDLIEIYERDGKIGGKCADQSSVFVALCRAVGVPAREVFGIRVRPAYISKTLSIKESSRDLTKAQHCRAEFWAGRWIPVDPADVTKMRLKENLKEGDPRLEFAKRYLFGNWDPHWVAFNWLRDGDLEPKQEVLKPMPFFGYPYAEVNGFVLNYLEPDSFVYRIVKV